MLGPDSIGSDRLRDFVAGAGMTMWFFDRLTLARAFELMEHYADHPMDLADASIITAAEALGSRSVFTLDRKDFRTYRVRRGHRHYALEILP
jgi:predicted nucleic acid-binding protein